MSQAVTNTRLQLEIPKSCCDLPIVSQLVSQYGLVVNIFGARLIPHMVRFNYDNGYLDLELRGTIQQIQAGLKYLRSLNIQLIGKPQSAGDSWSY